MKNELALHFAALRFCPLCSANTLAVIPAKILWFQPIR